MERLAVMGAGALGMLMAGKMAAAGVAAELWTRTEEQARLINESGLLLEDPADVKSGGLRVRIEAIPYTQAPAGYDGIVFLAVKQTAFTPGLLQWMGKCLAAEAGIVLFQNGIGHPETVAAALPGRKLAVAVTTEGALRTGAASVRHTGIGETWVGSWDERDAEPAGSGADAVAAYAERVLKQAGFSVSVSKDIRERLLRKLLVNAVINPLSALWRIPNGQLPATEERRAVMDALLEETADILRVLGLKRADTSSLRELVLGVCSATADNRSSMLQDVLAVRETEIRAINGTIARMARAAGKEAPWNEAVTALVQAIRSPEESGL